MWPLCPVFYIKMHVDKNKPGAGASASYAHEERSFHTILIISWLGRWQIIRKFCLQFSWQFRRDSWYLQHCISYTGRNIPLVQQCKTKTFTDEFAKLPQEALGKLSPAVVALQEPLPWWWEHLQGRIWDISQPLCSSCIEKYQIMGHCYMGIFQHP